MPRFSYSLSEIASFLDVTLDGDPSAVITGIGTLASSGPDDLAFLSNPIYASQLSSCEAGVVILHPDQAESFNGNRLICEDPYLCYAKISHWFDPVPDLLPEIAPSATVDPSAEIGDRVVPDLDGSHERSSASSAPAYAGPHLEYARCSVFLYIVF